MNGNKIGGGGILFSQAELHPTYAGHVRDHTHLISANRIKTSSTQPFVLQHISWEN